MSNPHLTAENVDKIILIVLIVRQ